MKTLYEIGTDMKRFDVLLDECEGDLEKAAEQMPDIDSYLGQLGEDQAAKLDGYVSYLRQLDSEAAAAKAEEEQWAAKRKARERRAEFLKARLKEHLERTGQTKVVTATGRVIQLARNGGTQPLDIDLVALEDLEPAFVKCVYTVNKEAVREALEAGQTLPFARLGERGVRLVVK